MLVVEGQRAAEQRVEDDAARPDIDLGTGVEFARDDLGCGIVGAAAARAQKLAVHHHVAQAKVGDLDVQVRIEQQVLRLQVAVHHHVPVTVVDARDDLLEEPARFVFLQLRTRKTILQRLPIHVILFIGSVDSFPFSFQWPESHENFASTSEF